MQRCRNWQTPFMPNSSHRTIRHPGLKTSLSAGISLCALHLFAATRVGKRSIIRWMAYQLEWKRVAALNGVIKNSFYYLSVAYLGVIANAQTIACSTLYFKSKSWDDLCLRSPCSCLERMDILIKIIAQENFEVLFKKQDVVISLTNPYYLFVFII